MPQMKEQGKSPEKDLNEMEARNLPYFKNMVIRILKELSENFKELSESMRRHREIIKNKQLEMRNIIPEVNNRLNGINSGLDEAEE